MTEKNFNQYVTDYGKDILRFCRMTTGNRMEGDELYQDTMLKLWEQREQLNMERNIKSYAFSVAILLWKNRKRKFAWRRRLAPSMSYEEQLEYGDVPELAGDSEGNPENQALREEMIQFVRKVVRELPEKYRTVIYLYYTANMKISEMAECLTISESTVKSRMRKAKNILRKKLEVIGYDE